MRKTEKRQRKRFKDVDTNKKRQKETKIKKDIHGEKETERGGEREAYFIKKTS